MKYCRNLILLMLVVLVAACGGGGGTEAVDAGGGGGGGGQPLAPVLTIQPVSQSATAGSAATFSVSATGSALSYQWQRSTDGATSWVDVPLATSPSLLISAVVPAMDGNQYRAVVKAGTIAVASSAVTLSVSVPAAPAISVQPAGATTTAGGSVTFNVTATGTDLSYRWQSRSDPGTGWLDLVPAATSATLTLNGLTVADSGRQFRAVVDNAGGTATSGIAALTVNPAGVAPALASQPGNISVATGQIASFLLTVAGGVPAPSIQWQSSSDAGSTWEVISGATGTGYATPTTVLADNGKRFRAVLSNPSGTVISSVAILTVGAPQAPTINSTSSNQVAYWTPTDFAPKTATFGVSASGVPSPAFQWQVSTNGGASFSNVNGATSAEYTTPPVANADNGKLFRVVVTNQYGSVTSGSLRLYALNAGFGGRVSGMAVNAAGEVFVATYPSYIYTGIQDGFMGVRRWQAAMGVSTLAGGFTVRDTGPDVDATGPNARFQRPQGIAIDSAGNIFVADWGDRIRKVTPAGVVTTLAGGNAAGGLINGVGPSASFSGPSGLAIDAAGNLFVADTGNSAIRKVTPAGVVSTIASGPGFYSLDSLAIDRAGNLYATDFWLCRLWKITQSGVVMGLNSGAGCLSGFSRTDGSLASATFARTEGITVDPFGNIYVADFDRVRKITPAGEVSTLSSRFAVGIQIGRGITTDSAGNLYVADVENSGFVSIGSDIRSYVFRVRKITPAGAETTFP